jgi:hypothetical protein
MSARPPVRPSDPLLPLRGSETFSWKVFETFAEQFVAAKTGRRAVHYGKQGEKQFGIDCYVDLDDGSRWTFQLRQVEQFTEADAKATVQETTYEAARHFVVTACEVGRKVRDYFDSIDGWEVWDIRDVSQFVRMLPAEMGRRLVYQCFGEEWVRNFFSSSSVASFLTPEMFFDSRPGDLLRHDLPLVGRESQVEELEQFIASDAAIAIVTGRGGLGKSRLLAELPQLRAGLEVRYAARNVQLGPDAVRDLPLEPTIVVVDDVHERDDWPVALEIAQQRGIETKVILALRPYALGRVRTAMTKAGFSPTDVREISRLQELDRDDTRRLVQAIIGDGNEKLVALLTHRASDAPVVAVVAARLLRAKEIDIARLSSDDEIRRVIFDRFTDETLGRVTSNEPRLVRQLLELIAALAPVSVDDPTIRSLLASFLKIETDELVTLVDEVTQAGVLRHRGSRVRITPEVMSDYILERACFTSTRKATGFATRVYCHFRPHGRTRLLRNLAEADWRVRSDSGESLDEVWTELRDDFKAATITERGEILGAVAEVAAFQPSRALAVCELAISQPVGDVSELEAAFKFDQSHVLQHIPAILKNVSYNFEYLPRCIRMLWQLGRDDRSPQNSNFNHPFRVLTELAEPHPRRPSRFLHKTVETVVALLNAPGVHDHAHSLIDVLKAALHRQGLHHWMEDAGSFNMASFVVSRDSVVSVHNLAIAELRRLVKDDRIAIAVKAAKALAEYARPLNSGTLGQVIRTEQQEAWQERRLETLGFLKEIAQEASEPLIALEIFDGVEFSAFNDADAEIRRAAQAVVEAVLAREDTEDTILVVDGWGNRYQLHDDEDIEQGRKRRQEEFRSRLKAGAERLVGSYQPRELIDFLGTRITAANTCGLRVSPQQFLHEIANCDPSYTEALIESIAASPDHPIAPWAGTLLIGLSQVDRASAFQQAHALSLHPDAQLRAATSALLSLNEEALPPDAASLFARLLTDVDVTVRRAAIRNIWWAAKKNISLLSQLLSSLTLEGDEHFAREVAELFGRTNASVFDLPVEAVTRLVDQMGELRSLDDHYVSEFLASALLVIPFHVLEMFMRRVEAREESIVDRAVPYGFRPDRSKLCDRTDYADIVRAVRDAMLPESIWKGHYMPMLFKGIAHVRHPVTREVLGEWFRSGEQEKLEAAARLLSDLPSRFVFVHRDWVVEVLESAAKFSDECWWSVATSFSNSAICEERSASHGVAFPQDVKLLRDAEEAIQQLEPHSPGWRFFETLARGARGDIERKRIADENAEEEFLD